MKGVIVLCTKEMVEKKFGREKWLEALKNAGIDKEPRVLPISDVEDHLLLTVVQSICHVMGIGLKEFGELFGDYWVNEYSQRLYKVYYDNAKDARDFLLMMDDVHVNMTKGMENAKPPRFLYEWKDNKTLVITYLSQRHLIDIMVGLIKAVGKFYGEKLEVKKLSDDKVEVVFS